MIPRTISKAQAQMLDPRKSAHKHLVMNSDKNVKLKVLQLGEPLDAPVEAAMRHEMKSFYPRLKLKDESITNDNYTTVKERFPEAFKPHPSRAPTFVEERMCTNTITWDKECDVYIVYGIDPCRGELEKEENTVDDNSPVPPQNTSSGSST
ncbi:unnamed protein product [Bursaphelenchus okinawaensis]|uniref:Uncharacterized protein n=1 Tax=Bursaphelenchus okinawaensis TaxID=465554 RepID=A0A811LMK5_9BILA|nr:unnamed protein product [Bursaphelenchus okinawaensis]CAG9126349.1 unnamed protein product [Bursaphelenchus okinawaensis]